MNYDDEYDYNEEILDKEEQEVQEIDLPKVVREWEKVAISYSRYNNIPAIIGFYVLLGDLVKHMVEVPYRTTTVDTRIHFCWIQTARSGKTTLIMYVLNPVAKAIFEELKDDGIESTVLNFADYNTPSLVGSHVLNESFVENAEEIYAKEMDTIDNNVVMNIDERTTAIRDATVKRDKTMERWIVVKGPIQGEGLWFADEFEGSGVFKDRTHKEGMNILFQTIMNNFHNGANKYEKVLTGKPVIELDCKYTMIACTFPPDKLTETITKKGILQRFLPYIWLVPDDTLTLMRKEVTSGFGTLSEVRGPPLHLKKGILEIYKIVKERFKDMGEDRFKTMAYHPSAVEVLDMEHNNLLRYIDNCPTQIRNVIRLFEMNLLEYIGKLAVLNAIAMAKGISNPAERFIVYPQNIRQGAYIVRKCYEALVEWLENSIRVNHNQTIAKSGWKDFQHAYQLALDRAKPQERLEGGYVWKELVFDEASKILKVAKRQVRNKYKALSEMFESQKKGKQAYIKPKKQEG